jgi:hypothetical protein
MKLLAAPGAVTGRLVPCILRDSTALRPRRALAFPNSMTLASISISPRPWASPWMPVALASTAPTSPSCAISSAPLARSSLAGRLSIQHTSVRQIWRRSARLAATNRLAPSVFRVADAIQTLFHRPGLLRCRKFLALNASVASSLQLYGLGRVKYARRTQCCALTVAQQDGRVLSGENRSGARMTSPSRHNSRLRRSAFLLPTFGPCAGRISDTPAIPKPSKSWPGVSVSSRPR